MKRRQQRITARGHAKSSSTCYKYPLPTQIGRTEIRRRQQNGVESLRLRTSLSDRQQLLHPPRLFCIQWACIVAMLSLAGFVCGAIALSTPFLPRLQKVQQLSSPEAQHASQLNGAVSKLYLPLTRRFHLLLSNSAWSLNRYGARHAHITASVRGDEHQDGIPLQEPVTSMAQLQRAAAALRSEGGDAKERFAELLNLSMEEGFTPDAGQLAVATLLEPGGYYEVDLEELKPHIEALFSLREAEELIGADAAEVHPFDDPTSSIYKFRRDELAAANQKAHVARIKKRINLVFRPLFFGGSVACGALRHLRSATTVQRIQPLLLVVPLAYLLSAAVRNVICTSRERSKDGWRAPRAEASQVVSTQYLLAASAQLVGALFALGCMPDASLFLTLVTRPIMLISLWYWRDLNQEVKSRSTPGHLLFIVWRLLATGSALIEFGIAGRLAADTALLSTAVAHLLSPLPALGLRRLRPQRALALAWTFSALYFCYAAWWAAFPAEGFERRDWRPALLSGRGSTPNPRPVRTLGTELMQALRVARPEPWDDELVRETHVSSVAPPLKPNATAYAPVPMARLRLSADRNIRNDPGIDLADTCEFFDLLDYEPGWNDSLATGKGGKAKWWNNPEVVRQRNYSSIFMKSYGDLVEEVKSNFDALNMTSEERIAYALEHWSTLRESNSSKRFDIKIMGRDDDLVLELAENRSRTNTTAAYRAFSVNETKQSRSLGEEGMNEKLASRDSAKAVLLRRTADSMVAANGTDIDDISVRFANSSETFDL